MERHCGKRSSQRVRLKKGESPTESNSLRNILELSFASQGALYTNVRNIRSKILELNENLGMHILWSWSAPMSSCRTSILDNHRKALECIYLKLQ